MSKTIELPPRPTREHMKQFATALFGFSFIQHAEFKRWADEVEESLKSLLAEREQHLGEIERLKESGISWRGFNVYGDRESISEVRKMFNAIEREEAVVARLKQAESELSLLRATSAGWIDIRPSKEGQ